MIKARSDQGGEVMQEITDKFDKKDDVTLGRLLREVENQTSLSSEILKEGFIRKGNAHIVGITGPPGAGKSTLVSKICRELINKGLSIGVVCVDPTSPFTKGALLGDRIRMQELAKLPNVFIKSLATRGSLGGLAETTADNVQIMDAFEKDSILIETVGVGQAELDILDVADTIVLVNVPGLGDTLQTLKAGIMEIADLFVINQADRPGANESVKDLKMMIRESGKVDWKPSVIKTVATEGEGVERLVYKVNKHKEHLQESGLWEQNRKDRNDTRLNKMIINRLNKKVQHLIETDQHVQRKIKEVKNGENDPAAVSNWIVENLK